MNGRYEIMASGKTIDHVERSESEANARLARAGLIVWECPQCREIVETAESSQVCTECGYQVTMTADGYVS